MWYGELLQCYEYVSISETQASEGLKDLIGLTFLLMPKSFS